MSNIKRISGKKTPIDVANSIDWDNAKWSIIIIKNEDGDVEFSTSHMSTMDLNPAAMDLLTVIVRNGIARVR